MNNRFWVFGIVFSLVLLMGCSQKEQTGPGDVRWDRMSCELCRMSVSDHYFSAQVRGGSEGMRTKLYYFDDLGCAILWLEKQEWKADSRTEIWVNDQQTGEWINATQASYTTNNITPMDFGLGANINKTKGTLSYPQAVQHIYRNDERKTKKRNRLHDKPFGKDKDHS